MKRIRPNVLLLGILLTAVIIVGLYDGNGPEVEVAGVTALAAIARDIVNLDKED